MSGLSDEFCDALRVRLDMIDERIADARSHVGTVVRQGEDVLRKRLEELRTEIQGRKKCIKQTIEKMIAWVQQHVDEEQDQVARWKADRQFQHLEARAERAAAYATDATNFAVATVDEAEAAILEAMVARLDAGGFR